MVPTFFEQSDASTGRDNSIYYLQPQRPQDVQPRNSTTAAGRREAVPRLRWLTSAAQNRSPTPHAHNSEARSGSVTAAGEQNRIGLVSNIEEATRDAWAGPAIAESEQPYDLRRRKMMSHTDRRTIINPNFQRRAPRFKLLIVVDCFQI